jgi:hypothetical protein
MWILEPRRYRTPELSALCLPGRRSATSSTLPALYVSVIFETGSSFIILCVLPYKAGVTDTDHCVQPLVEVGLLELLAWVWPRTSSLLIATSQVARTTGMSHWHLVYLLLYQYIVAASSNQEKSWKSLDYNQENDYNTF